MILTGLHQTMQMFYGDSMVYRVSFKGAKVKRSSESLERWNEASAFAFTFAG